MSVTLMIIDDDAEDRELFCEAVNRLDKTIQCIQAADVHQAFLLLHDKDLPRPHFIFLDLNMPVINGKQCLAKLKIDPTFSDIPVIIYSTSGDTEEIEEMKRLGAEFFLTKPTREPELVNALDYIVKGHEITGLPMHLHR